MTDEKTEGPDVVVHTILKRFMERYAEGRGMRLGKDADDIIMGIIKKDGCCTCLVQKTPCPCPGHMALVLKEGRCHCGLFVRAGSA